MANPTVTDLHGYVYLIGFIASGACTALLAVTIYFFKRLSNEVCNIRKDSSAKFEQLSNKVDATAKDIVSSFNLICHERQNACSMLVHEKMDRVKSESESTCKKIHDLELRRNKRWEMQQKFNDNMEKKLVDK